MTIEARPAHEHASSEHREEWRAATTMVLYVSIVLLAELAALTGRGANNAVQGPIGRDLISLVWGTTIGLALAHWFAFRMATTGLNLRRLPESARTELAAELGGAAAVATLVTIPVVLLRDDLGQEVVLGMLAIIIGCVGYAVERANGRSRRTSALFGVGTLAIAVAVAALKLTLSFH